jgi:hypothetical protein
MNDVDEAVRGQQVLLAGTLGMAMAEKVVEILHRRGGLRHLSKVKPDGTVDFDLEIPAPDWAILRTIVDAANECRGVFDHRPPESNLLVRRGQPDGVDRRHDGCMVSYIAGEIP